MLTKQQAVELCNKIHKHGKALDSEIQKAFQTAVFYSIVHGDITIGQKLVEVLNKGSRKQSLVTGLERTGQFQWDKENKALIYRKNEELFEQFHEQPEPAEAYVEGLKHWAEWTKEPIESVFDFEEGVGKLLKRMERAIDKKNAKHSDLYDVIRAAYDLWEENQTKQVAENDEQVAPAELKAA